MSEYVMVYDGWAKDFGERMDDLVSRFALYFRLKDVMHERRHEPIVRCRDCKYGTTDNGDHEYREPLYCGFHRMDVRPDGFCAWGKRKESE